MSRVLGLIDWIALNAVTAIFQPYNGGDDYCKRMPRVTVGVARKRILTAQWPGVPSKGQNLQPFNGNDEVSI